MFIYKLFYENKEKENLQDIIVVQMYEIVKIQMYFQSIYLIFLLMFFYSLILDVGKLTLASVNCEASDQPAHSQANSCSPTPRWTAMERC
jgi:hypothetical protein